MRFVHRVTEARVQVGDRTTGEIGRGLIVLLGVGKDDGPDDVKYVVGKRRSMSGLPTFTESLLCDARRTRVVFLERHHDRARAYIERARGALATRSAPRRIRRVSLTSLSAGVLGQPGIATSF